MTIKLKDIDWNQMWREAHQNIQTQLPDENTVETRWDNIAPQFRRWMNFDDYPIKFMHNVVLNSKWSVLDIGCGAGAISIPAAKKAARVTAIDISGEMIRILKHDARKHNLNNISCMHRSWDNVVVGEDLEPHDVVIASRSVGGELDIKSAIEKIDSAAIKYVYLTVWGGGERGHCKGVPKTLGRRCTDTQDHVYIYNILSQMGIHPNVEHLECNSRLIYNDLDEAMESCRLSMENLSKEEEFKARDYLDKNLLKTENGMLEMPDNQALWSLIWWKK
ncbi:MAG: class I SAM-dependent methyltransferase [Methanobacterium paludis]|nr:class I SAM-dependent methyltransferase [Methanobacterium paludis]